MQKIRLSAALFMASLQLAHAGEIKGAGTASCGVWLEDRKQGNHYSQLNWTLGFISAYNQFVYKGPAPEGIFGNVDAKAIAVWMDNFCRENPLETVYDGSLLLVEELSLREIKDVPR